MKQGEIWLINLDPTIGAEITKTRPAVIVNDDGLGKLPLRIIVPITEWKERYAAAPWMTRIEPKDNSGLAKISAADSFQVRSVSEKRFVRKPDEINSDDLNSIQRGLAQVLSLEISRSKP
jgi:mRNA interferase MazF